MNLEKMKRILFLIISIILFLSNIYADERDDVINIYNKIKSDNDIFDEIIFNFGDYYIVTRDTLTTREQASYPRTIYKTKQNGNIISLKEINLGLFFNDEEYFNYDNSQFYKQMSCFEIGNTSLFICDIDLDGNLEYISIEADILWDRIVFRDSNFTEIFSYSNPDNNLYDALCCIYRGKKGLRINQKYHVDENNDIDRYKFFYCSNGKWIQMQDADPEELKAIPFNMDCFPYLELDYTKLNSKLSAKDLQNLTKEQLRIYRNAIYARHGRSFKSIDLQSIYTSFEWYKKNPNYTDDLLTETDKYNIELIKEYERN